jgi:NADH-quinone oxidoreductase subunit G
VGAIDVKSSLPEVKAALENKNKKVVFQFAPSIRVAIGEEFGMAPGTVVTGQLIAGLKKLGADWVVDVDLGADLTTVAEAAEFKERLEKGMRLPMFTSCCPAWVSYVETHRPDLVPHLTTVRSPHIILGGVLKHIFAKRAAIKPSEMFVVSIMPCTAKKIEINRPQLNYKNQPPVDAVLTTRELAKFFREKQINLAELESQEPDSPLTVETGSGSIYGASGGVMEAALRTAYQFITGNDLTKIEFEEVRGMEDVKKAHLEIAGKKINIAVANGLGQAIKLIEELKDEPDKYHYIEVMSCPGGCIGGGGQPFSIDNQIRTKRQKALYNIDERNTIRFAHQNPTVKELFKNELSDQELRTAMTETYFRPHRGSPIHHQKLVSKPVLRKK